jgi:lipoprotein-anchoring transpeptidase ErfK/SrfK
MGIGQMRNGTGRLVLAAVMAVGLSACIPVEGPEGVVAVAAPAPEPAPVADTVYVSRQDGAFSIPALPVEQIPEEFRRQTVEYVSDHPPGTIIVNPAAKQLLFVTGPDQAIRYGIAVGKAGFEWSGEAVVSGRRTWPSWTPPPEMIARSPNLAKWAGGQPGGPTNPLGARALYLTTNGIDYGYRIHGTPEWQSIGRNASSGCIRMINQDVIDLYARVPDGAKVIVMTRDGQMPQGLSLPPPAPRPAKVKPKPQTRPVTPGVIPPLPPALPPPVII